MVMAVFWRLYTKIEIDALIAENVNIPRNEKQLFFFYNYLHFWSLMIGRQHKPILYPIMPPFEVQDFRRQAESICFLVMGNCVL